MSLNPTPAKRTALTAKVVMIAGILFALEAMLRDSLARGMVSLAVISGGGLLLAFAKRAD